MKSLKDISWNVSEKEYRDDPSLSYSIIASYIRGGFHSLSSLFSVIKTPSIIFGSIVDALMTWPQEEFEKEFYISDSSKVSPKVKLIIDTLIETLGDNCPIDIRDIEKGLFLYAINKADYNSKWKDDIKRIDAVIFGGEKYYKNIISAKGKTIISEEDYIDAQHCVSALKNSDTTKYYFMDDPFNNEIERLYQLKFKGKNGGIPYKCMFDLLIVDHKNKKIQPIDLKTSSHYEDEFFKSFLSWNYDIQARNYYRLLEQNISQDDYFKDFEILDYKFIVVCRNSLKPLVWDFEETKAIGDVVIENPINKRRIVFKDPWIVGKELWSYLTHPVEYPNGINYGEGASNSLIDCIRKEYLS